MRKKYYLGAVIPVTDKMFEQDKLMHIIKENGFYIIQRQASYRKSIKAFACWTPTERYREYHIVEED